MKKPKNPLEMIKFPEIISKIGSPFGLGMAGVEKDFFDSGFEIRIISGMDQGNTYPLNSKEITLGRKESPDEVLKNHILFVDSSVSRVHAVLRWDLDLEKYVIYHLSKENPTLVNGRAVKKSLLNPNYRVQVGELSFEVVSIKEKRRRESTVLWQKFKAGDERGEKEVDSGYKLIVVEGPDKGESFDLDKNLMIIGRRKGAGDIRDTYGILLSDSDLPDELALLVWNENEGKYNIFQSEDSQVAIKLFRVMETAEGSRIVGREFQNILEDKDSIMAGQTVMVVHKATEAETPDAKVDIEKELKIESLAGMGGMGLTAPGSFRIDFVFEVLDGPGKGQKISLLSDEMNEGKIITFGKSGDTRQNDIELEDETIDNTQGYLEFSEGNLYLINEIGQSQVKVNKYVINENEKIVLNSGDHIRIGDTILGFTDNRVLAALRNYSLVVIAGEEDDKSKRFTLTRTAAFIGRGSACDVRVLDPEISRLHAVFTFKSGRFHLEHKSNINPTFVNGVSLKKGQDRIVFPGDKIYLSGKTILQLIRANG
ncbi:MAG: FHA domain-containing protein [Candidatus Eremiobacteraeota bacterium]|nr:FHA domain-containing protein [Candidatus Eremiobacteraeota bacterium]